jgi:hypothetical protein
MPYTIRKLRGKNCYSVKKRQSLDKKRQSKGKRRTLSKCTTLKKAKAQIRLLNAIEHNPGFKPRSA